MSPGPGGAGSAAADERGEGFRARVERESAPVREAVDALPFLAALADGSLPPAVFRHYLEQDRCYLREYARALALLAARAPDPAHAAVWAGSAAGAVAAERDLHADLLGHALLAAAGAGSSAGEAPVPGESPAPAAEPSPTTLAYSSWLVAQAATAPYAVGAAAVLPCFTVYAEVGLALAERAARRAEHPYARWTAAYAEAAFQQASARAADVVVEAVAADPAHEDAAVAAAVRATRFEWMFWDAASRKEGWPL
ncbi:TenA family transcriptional regulator [uncultured Pseudokineococcus sp.]|uniref:TenA family transcriptional regulator n=1 Tax=uncultured Pseudokineococcus sp. TaxID=1642928 RepID=UPI0026089EF1|nr:TenA family transcriptional regulator [uncultured Pseudokineococcus sp.]